MSQHLPDFEASDAWQDITILPQYAPISGQAVTVQNKGTRRALVWFGGATQPVDAGAGAYLSIGESVTGEADHIWVKGRGTLSIWLED